MSERLTGFCPNCGNKLTYTANELTVECDACDSVVDVNKFLDSLSPNLKEELLAEDTMYPQKRKVKPKIFSVLCAVLATIVMGGALVYYNFIDKKKVVEGVAVGDTCPDFTVDTIVAENGVFGMSDIDYNLRAHDGKVRVINFWATWCSACKHELPFFDEFAKAYPMVEVVAICGASGSDSVVQKWMNNEKEDAQTKGWADYSLTFGFYGPDKKLYEDMGGTGFWPMTVIIDEEGVIRYSEEVEMDFASLEKEVLPLLND